jgi:peroxiredoxin
MVYGIASREDEATVRSFVDRLGITYPILLDEDGSVVNQYSQEMAFPSAAYPQDWVIGAEGIVVYANNGFELDAMVTAIENEL